MLKSDNIKEWRYTVIYQGVPVDEEALKEFQQEKLEPIEESCNIEYLVKNENWSKFLEIFFRAVLLDYEVFDFLSLRRFKEYYIFLLHKNGVS